MAKTMGEPIGLTDNQQRFLSAFVDEPYLIGQFYLSGGTALAAWYLHHRESYDLDFFTTRPFDYDRIIRWMKTQESVLRYASVRFEDDYGFLTCFLRFSKDTLLKIDFHHSTSMTLEKGLVWRGLSVDSLFDITVNKLRTIATTPRTRDYVDYYYASTFMHYPIKTLLPAVSKKFHETIDPLQLAKNFLSAATRVDLPIMRVPFDENAMIAFYKHAASELHSSILA